MAEGIRERIWAVRLGARPAGRPIGRPGSCGSGSGAAMGLAAVKAARARIVYECIVGEVV